MKFVLISMIKNEEKIILRCLESLKGVVDCFCICDTGSTDNTVNIVKEFLTTNTGCLSIEPWKNFGYNRTFSFQIAQNFIKEHMKWDLSTTYGILVDADMVFVPGNLKSTELGRKGYQIIQNNGAIEYYNTRLVRMDVDWKCVGVTHEYWMCDNEPVETLRKDVCYINDRNDGGCKHDKFERDLRLLEQGLMDEPENSRYMFYLGQTYKCLGMYKESIKMYKDHIKSGSWPEEVWYSHYMIGQCHLLLKNYPKFEYWMLKAYEIRPCRAEPIYKLVEHFRLTNQVFKAYHYIQIGRKVPFPKDDILFIESDIYSGKFDYEASIVDYYIFQDKQIGLVDSVKYLMSNDDRTTNILSNLKFYINPIQSKKVKLDIPNVFGRCFHPSAVSVVNYPYANVRFVNYLPPLNDEYRTHNGEDVQTFNAYVNLETKEYKMMNDASVTLDRYKTNVKGLEDIRLFSKNSELWFTSTNIREYSPNISIVYGRYDNVNGMFNDTRVLKSPNNHPVEKNWLPILNTDLLIYSWRPFCIVDSNSNVVKKLNSPKMFSLFRGSAPPIKIDDFRYWCMIHFVRYTDKRQYYHSVVELGQDYTPKKFTLPFIFSENRIEYCVSMIKENDLLTCFVSFMDSDPHMVTINTDNFVWVDFYEM